jgi:hypothetical protein
MRSRYAAARSRACCSLWGLNLAQYHDMFGQYHDILHDMFLYESGPGRAVRYHVAGAELRVIFQFFKSSKSSQHWTQQEQHLASHIVEGHMQPPDLLYSIITSLVFSFLKRLVSPCLSQPTGLSILNMNGGRSR